jgi:hypothetical protein
MQYFCREESLKEKGMRTMPFFGGVAALALFTGCADAPLQNNAVDGKVVCHPDKMAQVEADAKRTGKQLMWVNCPQAVLRTR